MLRGPARSMVMRTLSKKQLINLSPVMHPTSLYPIRTKGTKVVVKYPNSQSFSCKCKELQPYFTINALDPKGLQKRNNASNVAGQQAQLSQVGPSTVSPPCSMRGLC